jgi:AcrR family transcriptional regulator
VPNERQQNSPRSRRQQRRENPSIPLTREHIVRTALAIVDRDGVKALSMRRLGADLGVDPMAVYYHIPNKEALLDAIVEAVMSEIDLSVDVADAPPEERIMTAARVYLDVLLAHGNALPIMLSRGPSTPMAVRPVEYLVGVLRDAGLPPAQAIAGMNAIAAAVRGLAAIVPTDPGGPPPAEAVVDLGEAPLCGLDFLRDFEFGVRALAKGLLLSAEHS